MFIKKVQQTTGFAVFFPEKKKKKEDTFCAPVRKRPCDIGKRQGYGNAGGMNISIARTVHRTWHVMCDVIERCLSLFSRRQLRDFTSDKKKSKREEQEGESRQQKESFQLEIDAEDPAQTRESKRQKSENQEKRRAAMEQRHLERTEELREAQEDLLLHPEALAVACAAIKEDDREEERERVAQEGRKMAAHEQREGGSSSSARAALRNQRRWMVHRKWQTRFRV
jgi:hypothetical protein